MRKGTTAQITAADLLFLDRRGARSHRGPGTFSRSTVLHRELQLLRALLTHYDPRRTRAMPEDHHRLLVTLLPEPWTLKPADVHHLANRLQESPHFAAAVTAAGLDPADLLASVAALEFAEKAALLDHALQEQAPAASEAARQEG